MIIKDWTAFRKLALGMAENGVVPVYGDFGSELEAVVTECIYTAQQQGLKELTLLINTNGGSNDCFNGIRAAMIQSGIKFTGIVMARARSNGFRLLQCCQIRKAVENSMLQFHWGNQTLGNSELHAIVNGEDWPIKHILRYLVCELEEVNQRTGIPVTTLSEWALYERNFTAGEALDLKLLDEIVPLSEVPDTVVASELQG